ncbi:acyl carrier protein [Streptomyces buecherae]|uniref:Acyl carrier protein n=1 Tax=Streptomyces buecherae TaxID=2763006 RepID=A0A7H8N2J6_9ACTN|nr:acyl carrier protein [Streptomyces buecherae]MBC3989658.1 acyl carrier protein [Streptomyces buecherae]QKW48543.1 acyl carrier protein [Streptomyces buecherae]
MNQMDVHEKVLEIIAQEIDVPVADLSGDQHFRALPNVDSMRVLQVILKTEKAFDIEIEDDVTFRIQTVGEFQKLVAELYRQRAAA